MPHLVYIMRYERALKKDVRFGEVEHKNANPECAGKQEEIEDGYFGFAEVFIHLLFRRRGSHQEAIETTTTEIETAAAATAFKHIGVEHREKGGGCGVQFLRCIQGVIVEH